MEIKTQKELFALAQRIANHYSAKGQSVLSEPLQGEVLALDMDELDLVDEMLEGRSVTLFLGSGKAWVTAPEASQ
ncbi:hypothetical protein LCGC14_0375210 [marine sediment metagenome]|uniref:Uncharacterized protein n=1 Tax=marine sediment metagenome TaxID=412755 RepID=A0A0F9T9V3_9ZZZZ